MGCSTESVKSRHHGISINLAAAELLGRRESLTLTDHGKIFQGYVSCQQIPCCPGEEHKLKSGHQDGNEIKSLEYSDQGFGED